MSSGGNDDFSRSDFNQIKDVNNILNDQQSGTTPNEMLTNEYNTKKSTLLQQVQNDDTIDEVTRADLLKQLNDPNGAHVDSIAQQLSDAQAGKGIYAARLANQKQINAIQDQPGISQVILAAGKQQLNIPQPNQVGHGQLSITGVRKTPVGDTSTAGLPSLLPNQNPAGTASLIAEAQKQYALQKGAQK